MQITIKSCAYLCVAGAFLSAFDAGADEPASSPESPAARIDSFQGKHRVFVLSDIGNEPDDEMSLTRFLLYSNGFDVEGLVAVTSTDQDDAGPWMRREFPDLFYIVSPSTPDGEQYGSATWTGISGDKYYRSAPGADFTTVSNTWLDKHVRSKGFLGETYPQYLFIMEGDTPSFLSLINNGLASYRNPGWGGWGGRYISASKPVRPEGVIGRHGEDELEVMPKVRIEGGDAETATVIPQSAGIAHVILAVADDGEPSLTSYRRVVLNIGN